MPLPRDYEELVDQLGFNDKKTQEDLSKVAAFKLDKAERESHFWLKLSEQLKERLQHLREMNDGELSYADTCAIRGRIDEIKGFLAIGQQDSFDLPLEESTPNDEYGDAEIDLP